MSETPRSTNPTAKSGSRPSAQAKSTAAKPVPKLPPRVVKKKESVKRRTVVEKQERAPSDPSELLVPIILIVVGFAAVIGTSIWLHRYKEIPLGLGLWLGIRMAMVVVSMVLTYGALFLAAMVVDTDYGYISTGIPKVAAIVLTQAWVGDLAGEIPFVGWIVAFIVTYTMFKFFFGLDDREAIASMIVVRVVHILAFVFVFVALVAAASGVGRNAIELPAGGGVPAPAAADPNNDADDAEDADADVLPGFN